VFHGEQIVVFDPRWTRQAVGAGLGAYASIIGYDGPVLSETITTRVYHLNPNPEIWPGGVYLKKFIYTSWARFFLRPAKAYLEVRNYRFLQKLNLNVPQVLAAGQRRKFGGLVDAFILTAGIENALSLEDYFRSKQQPEEIIEILDKMAQIVGIMHRANFFHIDLQWRNILIQRNNSNGQSPIKVFLIDCPRGGRRWFFLRSWNGRMHDLAGLDKLAGLYLTPKERLKWFKQYAGIEKLGWLDHLLIKRIVREIESRRRT